MNHELVEKNVVWLAVLIVVAIAFGGIVEIVPMMFQTSATKPAEGLALRTPLQVAGRDVYVREGCYNCHSQMVRALHEEVLRYGPRSTAGESVWDHPFQWGSKRTGPDLARVGGRYSDDWHRIHLLAPRDVVPESNRPGYPWLAEQFVDGAEVQSMMTALRRVGVPYGDADIAGAAEAVHGKTRMDALIAFLQSLRTPEPPQANASAPQTGEKS
ncbi:MAG: cytochrome-c oxidase, cbb3-type subunit II [Gammaproteobacteria bacterium]